MDDNIRFKPLKNLDSDEDQGAEPLDLGDEDDLEINVSETVDSEDILL